MSILHLILINSILVFFLVIYITKKVIEIKNKQFTIRFHKQYHQLFSYYLDVAYDTIWKSQILAYINEKMKPSGSERETMTRNYCKTVSEVMGPKLEKYFIEFFGSQEILWINIVHYFEYRLDTEEVEDIIKKTKQSQAPLEQGNKE